MHVAERQHKLQRQRDERQCSAELAMGPNPTHVRTSSLLQSEREQIYGSHDGRNVSITSPAGTFAGLCLPRHRILGGNQSENLSGRLDTGARFVYIMTDESVIIGR